MSSRSAKLMTHPFFVMSAPKAHYPLFNLVEKNARPVIQKSRSPSGSPKRRRRPSPKGRGREVKDKEVVESVLLEEPVVATPPREEMRAPVVSIVQESEICEEEEEVEEEEEEDVFFDDELSLPVDFPRSDIDFNRFSFDDGIGCSSRSLAGRSGRKLEPVCVEKPTLERTAAQIMAALQKTEEEIRKLEQIALAESKFAFVESRMTGSSGGGLIRQRSHPGGWLDESPRPSGVGTMDDSLFFTPKTPSSEMERPLRRGSGRDGESWADMNASLSQLIYRERMLPTAAATTKEKKVHFKSNSIGEETGDRTGHFSADEFDDVPRRRHSGDYASERAKVLKASKQAASPEMRSACSTPGRPSFTLDESSSGRLFSIEKLDSDFPKAAYSSRLAGSRSLQDSPVRALGKDTRRMSEQMFGGSSLQEALNPATRLPNKQLAECPNCKCMQEKSSSSSSRMPTPDRSEISMSRSSSRGGLRVSQLARAEKAGGGSDSPLRHDGDTTAQPRSEGFRDGPSRHDSPLRREKGTGSDSPFRNDKPEPLQVKLAAPQSPLRSQASPGRPSVSGSTTTGREFSGGASPLRSRRRVKVKLRLMSPFQFLRKLKEVCARLILAASSSVKPEPVMVDNWSAAAGRASTSSNCSFVSAAAVPATPGRVSESTSVASSSPRISTRKSSVAKRTRGSPYICSPALSRHSFYSEAISDCIEFIKRSSTPDTRIVAFSLLCKYNIALSPLPLLLNVKLSARLLKHLSSHHPIPISSNTTLHYKMAKRPMRATAFSKPPSGKERTMSIQQMHHAMAPEGVDKQFSFTAPGGGGAHFPQAVVKRHRFDVHQDHGDDEDRMEGTVNQAMLPLEASSFEAQATQTRNPKKRIRPSAK